MVETPVVARTVMSTACTATPAPTPTVPFVAESPRASADESVSPRASSVTAPVALTVMPSANQARTVPRRR